MRNILENLRHELRIKTQNKESGYKYIIKIQNEEKGQNIKNQIQSK